MSVDDFRTGRGVVLGRAVPMLRSVETQPLTGGFVLMAGRSPLRKIKFFPGGTWQIEMDKYIDEHKFARLDSSPILGFESSGWIP